MNSSKQDKPDLVESIGQPFEPSDKDPVMGQSPGAWAFEYRNEVPDRVTMAVVIGNDTYSCQLDAADIAALIRWLGLQLSAIKKNAKGDDGNKAAG